MRLIDVDALIEQMESDAEHLDDMTFKFATYAAINDVKHQPIIVEFDGDINKVVVKGEEYQKKPQWIPYSEKMPGIGMNAIFTFLTGGYRFVGEGCRRYDDSVWLYRADSMAPKENVLAWMPLPEPHKGEEE